MNIIDWRYHPTLHIGSELHDQAMHGNFPANDNFRFDFLNVDLVKLYGEIVYMDYTFLYIAAGVNNAVNDFYTVAKIEHLIKLKEY